MLCWGKAGLNLASQIVALPLLFVPWDMYQVSILDAMFLFCDSYGRCAPGIAAPIYIRGMDGIYHHLGPTLSPP